MFPYIIVDEKKVVHTDLLKKTMPRLSSLWKSSSGRNESLFRSGR